MQIFLYFFYDLGKPQPIPILLENLNIFLLLIWVQKCSANPLSITKDMAADTPSRPKLKIPVSKPTYLINDCNTYSFGHIQRECLRKTFI